MIICKRYKLVTLATAVLVSTMFSDFAQAAMVSSHLVKNSKNISSNKKIHIDNIQIGNQKYIISREESGNQITSILHNNKGIVNQKAEFNSATKEITLNGNVIGRINDNHKKEIKIEDSNGALYIGATVEALVCLIQAISKIPVPIKVITGIIAPFVGAYYGTIYYNIKVYQKYKELYMETNRILWQSYSDKQHKHRLSKADSGWFTTIRKW